MSHQDVENQITRWYLILSFFIAVPHTSMPLKTKIDCWLRCHGNQFTGHHHLLWSIHGVVFGRKQMSFFISPRRSPVMVAEYRVGANEWKQQQQQRKKSNVQLNRFVRAQPSALGTIIRTVNGTIFFSLLCLSGAHRCSQRAHSSRMGRSICNWVWALATINDDENKKKVPSNGHYGI